MTHYHLIGTNAKLDKQNGVDFLIAGLSLAPHRRAGVNTCESAGFCSAVCNLWFAGRTVTAPVREAMIRRTRLLFDDRAAFHELLREDIAKLAARAARMQLQPLFRPNVASDLDFSAIAREFPRVSFYDYAKVRSRSAKVRRGDWPENYQLTYSHNEHSHHRTIGAYLRAGRNVSAVFDVAYHPQSGQYGSLPDTWRFDGRNWPVVDGDKHDIRLREIDGAGVVVGLRFKGSRRLIGEARRRGFVLSVQ